MGRHDAIRLVIPKELRDELGLRPGPVRVTADGAALRVEPVHSEEVAQEKGWLTIPPSGLALADADVRALRDAGQRQPGPSPRRQQRRDPPGGGRP